MTQYKKITAQIGSFLLIAAVPFVSFAQIKNPLGNNVNSIPVFVGVVLGDVVKVGAVIAIFAFVYAGFRFVAARGNPGELQKAKEIFIYTCVGVAVLLGAQLIASIVVGTVKNLQS